VQVEKNHGHVFVYHVLYCIVQVEKNHGHVFVCHVLYCIVQVEKNHGHVFVCHVLYCIVQVEKNHGHVFVCHVLSYLTASKNGLSDVEMEDVLSLDDVVLNDVFQHWLPPIRRVPPLLLPRLYDELSCYIMQREANGTVVFYWYHRQFIFVARERYLADIAHRIYIHTSLAHYFLGTWGGGKRKPFTYSATQLTLMDIHGNEKDAADRKVPLQPLILGNDPTVVYNLRKLSELPYHLLESRQCLVLKQEVILLLLLLTKF